MRFFAFMSKCVKIATSDVSTQISSLEDTRDQLVLFADNTDNVYSHDT